MSTLGSQLSAAASNGLGTIAAIPGKERLAALHEAGRGAAGGLQTAGRNLAENVSEHAEHVDFFSENTIGACVTCTIALSIWLVFLPVFHLGLAPVLQHWEQMHALTVPEYMRHAEETYATPHMAFGILDADGDHNSTKKEFAAGSKHFKRPPFDYPADVYPIFDQIDTNNDGLIQDKEFWSATPSGSEMKWHLNMNDLKTRAKRYTGDNDGQHDGSLDSYYTYMDMNSDGKVSVEEFTAMAGTLEPPVPLNDAKELFKEADTDSKGFIAPREWVSYNVTGDFTFKAGLPSGIDPTGPRVMMAVEAGLRSALHILVFDLLTISGVEKAPKTTTTPTTTTTGKKRILSSQMLETVFIKVTFTVLIGTRSRQSLMQTTASILPNSIYMAAFASSITGGTTTFPIGPMTTVRPQPPGPVLDKDLKAYMGVPAVVQGHTELFLKQPASALWPSSRQEKMLKPIIKASFDFFCKCGITVESVQTTEQQDETGAGGATNKTMFVEWSTDLKHGGVFEREMEDNGHQLMHSLYANIMQANLPSMVGVSLDSWTRFTTTYYGSVAGSLPRGAVLEQRFGHYKGPGGRNDTGTPPFIEHP